MLSSGACIGMPPVVGCPVTYLNGMGGILAEGNVADQCRLSSMDQCPRKKSASWAGLAWVTVSEVTA